MLRAGGRGPEGLGARLDRLAFHPESLAPDTVFLVALLPPIGAGLLLFRLPAVTMLALAAAVGWIIERSARLLRQPLAASPLLAALVGVALCGPGALPVWVLATASGAALLEVLRGRLLPGARLSSGLLAYCAVFLAADGAPAAYLRPGGTLAFPEPIQQWSRFYGGANTFLDPATLYVGNVAGPVFATSLLAVVISIAWLWYARRVSLSVLLAFAVAAAGVSFALHWDPLFQLDSGPTWFVAGLLLADRRLLPVDPIARPLVGLAAGVLGMGLRAGSLYLEGFFLTVAGLQLTVAAVGGVAGLLAATRRRRASRRSPVQKEPASA